MFPVIVQLACLLTFAQPGAAADGADAADDRPVSPAERFGVEPIKPVLDVVLPVVDSYPSVEDYDFSPDGRTAFVSDTYETVLVWPLMMDYWRWWLGAIAGLSLLLALWSIRRVLVSRRAAGRPYCRRCNYDLTGNVSGKCSECGAALAEAAPIAGRSTRRRLLMRAPWLAPPLLYVVLLLLPHNTRFTGVYGDDPVVIADIAGWFEWRSRALFEYYQKGQAEVEAQWDGSDPFPEHWLSPWIAYMSRLREVDLRDGTLGATVVDGDGGAAAFSPDGTRMFITNCGAGDGVLWDLRERRIVRTIKAPTLPDHNIFCGTGLREKVRFFGNDTVRSHYLDLIEWDLRSGQSRRVAGKMIDATETDENGQTSHYSYEENTERLVEGVAMEQGSPRSLQLRKTRIAEDAEPQLPQLHLIAGDGTSIAQWPVPHTAQFPLRANRDYAAFDPLCYDDGRKMLLIWSPPEFREKHRIERWNLEERRFIDLMPVRFDFDPSAFSPCVHGHFLFLYTYDFENGPMRSHIVVMDLHSDRVVAALELPQSMPMPERVLFDAATRRAVVVTTAEEDGNEKTHALHYDLNAADSVPQSASR